VLKEELEKRGAMSQGTAGKEKHQSQKQGKAGQTSNYKAKDSSNKGK